MLRVLARVATAAALSVSGVALLPATTQADEVGVSGCFGAASAIVCNPKITYTLPIDVDTYETSVPVCAGQCYDVPVTLARAGLVPGSYVCLSYTDRAGTNTTTRCSSLAAPTVSSCTYYGQMGYIVKDGNGQTLVNACVDRPSVPRVEFQDCDWYETGTEVWLHTDSSSRRLVNACVPLSSIGS